MEIKVVIALDERAHDTLNKLADALSKEKSIPTEDEHPSLQETEKKPASKESKDLTNVQEETIAELNKNAEDGSPVPLETLRSLAADVKTKMGSAGAVKDLLELFGVKKLSELPEDKTRAFAQGLKELLDA